MGDGLEGAAHEHRQPCGERCGDDGKQCQPRVHARQQHDHHHGHDHAVQRREHQGVDDGVHAPTVTCDARQEVADRAAGVEQQRPALGPVEHVGGQVVDHGLAHLDPQRGQHHVQGAAGCEDAELGQHDPHQQVALALAEDVVDEHLEGPRVRQSEAGTGEGDEEDDEPALPVAAGILEQRRPLAAARLPG